MEQSNKILLEVNNLSKYFNVGNGVVKAVDGVTFSIKKVRLLG